MKRVVRCTMLWILSETGKGVGLALSMAIYFLTVMTAFSIAYIDFVDL